jgi:hypothetical protein
MRSKSILPSIRPTACLLGTNIPAPTRISGIPEPSYSVLRTLERREIDRGRLVHRGGIVFNAAGPDKVLRRELLSCRRVSIPPLQPLAARMKGAISELS